MPSDDPTPAATLVAAERPAAAESPDSVLAQHELKYAVPASSAAFIRNWLAASARPDPGYPPALVVTTYYDTADLELLDEKVNSDYLKTKVRVRWYATLKGDPSGSPVFVESKYRIGATRDKQRLVSSRAASELSALPLSHPAWLTLLGPLRTQAPDLPANLAPVMRLQYGRWRFLDRPGARITLDTDIAVIDVNPARLQAPVRLGTLPVAVFEYKGTAPDLPRHLAPLARLGARRTAFSKYLVCYEHVTRETF
jgi:hypothetical protein